MYQCFTFRSKKARVALAFTKKQDRPSVASPPCFTLLTDKLTIGYDILDDKALHEICVTSIVCSHEVVVNSNAGEKIGCGIYLGHGKFMMSWHIIGPSCRQNLKSKLSILTSKFWVLRSYCVLWVYHGSASCFLYRLCCVF
jgi:hypothetical protein